MAGALYGEKMTIQLHERLKMIVEKSLMLAGELA